MRHVIVGNGIAGVTAARLIRERDDEAEITLVSAESAYPYARTALMWIHMGQLDRRATEPFERSFWREQRIKLLQRRVTRIDREAGAVLFEQGEPLPFDRLLLAVGASPNLFGWPGQELDGVCTMTSLTDLDRLEAVSPRLRRAVVVGGGLIGIELVEMMLHRHVPVTYLIREPWYWNLVLSQAEGELVHRRLREHGVELVLEDEIAEIQGNAQGQVERVVTRAGQQLPCELLGIAVGVHANLELAQEAGLPVGRGIQVNASLQTGDERIFAAGDCAEISLEEGTPGFGEQLWYTGIKQGRVAGAAMVGDRVRYDPGIPYNTAQFLFLDYTNVGWMDLARSLPPERLTGGDLRLTDGRMGLAEFHHQASGAPDSVRIAHLKESGQVLGFSMLGSRWDSRVLMRWIEQRRKLPWVLGHLGQATFNEEFHPDRFRGGLHV